MTVLHGSLAPEGAVVKSAGFDADVFEGTARVFEREQGALEALDAGKIHAGDVVVICYGRTQGWTGYARDVGHYRSHQGRRSR